MYSIIYKRTAEKELLHLPREYAFKIREAINSLDRRQGDRWRIYEPEKMMELVILEEKNKLLRPFYNPYDKDFKRINFYVKIKQKSPPSVKCSIQA